MNKNIETVIRQIKKSLRTYLPKRFWKLAYSRIDERYVLNSGLISGTSFSLKESTLCLQAAFSWHNTPEGTSFWDEVDDYYMEKINRRILTTHRKMKNKLPKIA